MSWAARRQTSKPEDRAYSLIGLFSVNMPTLYVEGEKSAFYRLQTEIFRTTGDHSIFAWSRDQFHTLNHPRATREGHPELFSSDEKAGSDDLFALGPKMFAPGPRFQDLPLNLTSRFDIDGVEMSMIPAYPAVEPSPYELRRLNWEDVSTRVDSSTKYSAASHGMRVQLLLEHVHEFAPNLNVFIAHLACKFQVSNNVVGIYLLSDQPGQHHRIYPNVLLAIDFTYHIESRLVLEDVYITQTGSSLQAEREINQGTSLFGFDGEFCIRIVDKELETAGYKLNDHCQCKKPTNPNETLLTFEDHLWWKTDQGKRHVLLFGDLETPSPENRTSSIAVIWKIKNRMFQVGIEVDLDRYVKASGLTSQYFELPMTAYQLSQRLAFHYSKRSKQGKCVTVAFRKSKRKIFIYVIIF